MMRIVPFAPFGWFFGNSCRACADHHRLSFCQGLEQRSSADLCVVLISILPGSLTTFASSTPSSFSSSQENFEALSAFPFALILETSVSVGASSSFLSNHSPVLHGYVTCLMSETLGFIYFVQLFSDFRRGGNWSLLFHLGLNIFLRSSVLYVSVVHSISEQYPSVWKYCSVFIC